MFLIRSHVRIDRIATPQLADLLLAAPTWTRLGLAVPDDRLRQRAAEAMAARIIAVLDPVPPPHPDQLSLRL